MGQSSCAYSCASGAEEEAIEEALCRRRSEGVSTETLIVESNFYKTCRDYYKPLTREK